MNLNKNSLAACDGHSLIRVTALVGVLALCWLCSGAALSQAHLAPALGPAADQSFFAPRSWAQGLTKQQGGWGPNHLRMLADVNGDNRQDVVGFGHDGVWLATSTGTSFSLAFVLTNFGYDQSWRVDKHVRTTGDINGDNMDDIVGFGDHGVWTALSTGSGFGPAQLVLTEFGIDAGGWHLDRHPRLLADINDDGKQDIVGFAEYGVWLSLATSSGYFSAPTFVVEDFGYDQGWRVGTHPRFVDGVPQTGCTDSTCPERGTHPRFVADLNGDGYQDIVGFGHDSVYRSLGGPGGFGPVRGVLRALVVEQGSPWNAYPDVVPDWHPRLVGDVTGDGKYDLVAFDRSDIMVAPSSDLPPPPPPAAPTNLGVTGKTTTSLTLVWSDNSTDERGFFIRWGKAGGATERSR